MSDVKKKKPKMNKIKYERGKQLTTSCTGFPKISQTVSSCLYSSRNQTDFLKYQTSFGGSLNDTVQSAVYNSGGEDVVTLSNRLLLINLYVTRERLYSVPQFSSN